MPKVLGFNQDVKKTETCRHCGAINEYVPNDVRELSRGRDIDGGLSVSYGFNCANCRKEVVTRSF